MGAPVGQFDVVRVSKRVPARDLAQCPEARRRVLSDHGKAPFPGTVVKAPRSPRGVTVNLALGNQAPGPQSLLRSSAMQPTCQPPPHEKQPRNTLPARGLTSAQSEPDRRSRGSSYPDRAAYAQRGSGHDPPLHPRWARSALEPRPRAPVAARRPIPPFAHRNPDSSQIGLGVETSGIAAC